MLALLKGYQHFGEDRYAQAAARGARIIAAAEHRASRGTLAPRTGWAMGSAGIIRELLRYARIQEGRDPGYAVAWPDHPPAIPGRHLRRAKPAGLTGPGRAKEVPDRRPQILGEQLPC